jgi:hypothetical protein
MTTTSRPTAPAQEWEEFQARVRTVDPEVLEDFLHTVRWWSVSRDHDGMAKSERQANRRAMRVLTEVSRVFGALRLEAITRQ